MAKRAAHVVIDVSDICPGDMEVSVSFKREGHLVLTIRMVAKPASKTRSQPRIRRTNVRIKTKKGPEVLTNTRINIGPLGTAFEAE